MAEESEVGAEIGAEIGGEWAEELEAY